MYSVSGLVDQIAIDIAHAKESARPDCPTSLRQQVGKPPISFETKVVYARLWMMTQSKRKSVPLLRTDVLATVLVPEAHVIPRSWSNVLFVGDARDENMKI